MNKTLCKGADLMCFVSADGTAAAKAIGFATNHTFSVTAEGKDVSNKDLGGGLWTAQDVTSMSWTVTSENYFALDCNGQHTYKTIMRCMVDRKPVHLIFGFEGTNGTTAEKLHQKATNNVVDGGWAKPGSMTDYYEGDAIITSVELSAQNGEFSTYTVNFQGYGTLKINGKELTELEASDKSPAAVTSETTTAATTSNVTKVASK